MTINYNPIMQNQMETATQKIAKAAGIVMFAFILGNISSLVRQILVADTFGTQVEMDAFNAANRVAETLFTLVAGGALSSAFIPVFTSILTRGDKNLAWRLASAVGNIVFVLSILGAIIVYICAPQVVRYILAPGMSADPTIEKLIESLMRLMLPSAVIFALSGLVMGILNSHQKFFISAISPSMYQLGLIFGVIFLSPRLGIYGLAYGVLIGASLHLLVQIPSLAKLGGKYYPNFGINLSPVIELIKLIGPRLLGVAIVQLNFWINVRLASHMPEGSVTSLTIAFSLMLMPQAAIAQSIAIAALPTFSAQVAIGKLDEMRNSLASSLRGALLLTMPASIGIILMRTQIVSLLYQRGEFNEYSTQLVAWALLWYAAGLVFHALVEILSRAFYSLHDTRTPVFIGACAMALNLGFSYLFSDYFLKIGWLPHGGLALANTIATALEAGGLVLLMGKKLNGLNLDTILKSIAKTAIATIGLIFMVLTWMNVTNASESWVIVLGGVTLGAAIFFIIAWLIKIDEVKMFTGWIRAKIHYHMLH